MKLSHFCVECGFFADNGRQTGSEELKERTGSTRKIQFFVVAKEISRQFGGKT